MNTQIITRSAGALAAIVVVFSGIISATPAMADYGAAQNTQPLSVVCDGRYDPNCLLKETAYEQQLSAPYTRWNYQTPQPPVYPQAYGYAYQAPAVQYVSTPYTYGYQYSYQYSYPQAYTYVAPLTYGYNNYNSYDSYDSYATAYNGNSYYANTCASSYYCSY